MTPDEPSNILWENLEMKTGEKILRKMFVYTMILIILIASCFIIFSLKSIEIKLPTHEKCSELGIDGNNSLASAKAAYGGDDDQTNCWCKYQSSDDLLNDDDIHDFCEDYIDALSMSIGMSLVTAMAIIMLNFAIKVTLVLLTNFERT